MGSNQYGLGGREERNWGKDSLEGVLSAEELALHRADQAEDTAKYKFRDEEYYRTRDFNLADVEVPVLSAANWGGIHLHLRGNVMGFLGASSKFKFLRFLTGRHDIPFYYPEEVAVQKSFLDAFLKGVDDRGWLVPGQVPPVSLCLRVGNPGYNNPEAERRLFPRREEFEWPLARTVYIDYHLSVSQSLAPHKDLVPGRLVYPAPKGHVLFTTAAFDKELEVTGHPMLRVSLSLEKDRGSNPSEVDIFVTLRHLDSSNQESK